MESSESLTGVWHGLYTYTTQAYMPESHFVCVLIENGGRLTGTVHERMNHRGRAATQENATIEGVHEAGAITFTKTYDRSDKHPVRYSGHLNATRDEIEGTWKIGGSLRSYTGRFLMIRKRSEQQSDSEKAGAYNVREDAMVR